MTITEILDKLYSERDAFLNSGKLMQKNLSDKDGFTIFYRGLDDLERLIAYYENRQAYDEGGRIGLYA